jgi:hypothetical protein
VPQYQYAAEHEQSIGAGGAPSISVALCDDNGGAKKQYRTTKKDKPIAPTANDAALPPASSTADAATGADMPTTSSAPDTTTSSRSSKLRDKPSKHDQAASSGKDKDSKKSKKKSTKDATGKDGADSVSEPPIDATSGGGVVGGLVSSGSAPHLSRKQEEKELKDKLESARQLIAELQRRIQTDEETLGNMEQRFIKQEQETKLKHAKEIKALKKQLERAAPIDAAGAANNNNSNNNNNNNSNAATSSTTAASSTSSATTADDDSSSKKKSKNLDRDKSSKEKEEELQRLRKILAQLKTKYEEATQHNAKVKQQNIELKEQLEANKRTIDDQAHRLLQAATCGGVLDQEHLSTTPVHTAAKRAGRHRLDLHDADLVGSINAPFTLFLARGFLYLMVFFCVWSLFTF